MRNRRKRKVNLILLFVLAVLMMSLVPTFSSYADDNEEEAKSVNKLTRDMAHAKVGGVCAGLANYFSIDVSLVRIGWVIFTLLGGAGLLAYLVCWILIPAD